MYSPETVELTDSQIRAEWKWLSILTILMVINLNCVAVHWFTPFCSEPDHLLGEHLLNSYCVKGS